MNLIDAIKVARSQGRKVVEYRLGDYVMNYASLAEDEPWMNIFSATVLTDQILVSRYYPYNNICASAFLSDNWYPSNMGLKTLIDIRRSIDGCAHFTRLPVATENT